MKRKLRRRLHELEARIAALEAAPPASYDMPPRYEIDLDPDTRPLVDTRPDLAADWWNDDDDGYRTGVYL